MIRIVQPYWTCPLRSNSRKAHWRLPVCSLVPQLTTLWITQPELWWPLQLFSPSCLMAAPESWLAPTCQVCVCAFDLCLCVCVYVCESSLFFAWTYSEPLYLPGELKNPSYSIPRGTITAVIFTFIIYNLLCVLVACTCDRLVKHTHCGLGIFDLFLK